MSSLDGFAATSLRGPRKGTYEELLAAKLIMANRSEPLKRIRHITESLWFIGEKAAEMDVNMDDVETLYAVAIALDDVEPRKYANGNRAFDIYSISWPFSLAQENFERYISPWVHSFNYHIDLIRENREEWTRVKCPCGKVLMDEPESKWDDDEYLDAKYGPLKECPKCGRNIERMMDTYVTSEKAEFKNYKRVKTNPFSSFFWEATMYLTKEGYRGLVNSFTVWADPIVSQLEAALSSIVEPSMFREMFREAMSKEAEAEWMGGERENAEG